MKKLSKVKRRRLDLPGIGTFPEQQALKAVKQVRDVVVGFGRLMDHILGIKEMPQDEIEKFLR